MRIDLIDKVVKPVDEFISRETETLPFSSEQGFMPIEIDPKNFHDLSLFSPEKTLTAIDGGNANILNAPNFSVDFIRIAAATYNGKRRERIIKKEFFCLTTAARKGNSMEYTVDIYGDDLFEHSLRIDPYLETLDGEKYNIEISSVAGIVRRYAELRLAKIAAESGKNSIVIDGSIKAKTEFEKGLIQDIISTGVSVGFLSKTCRLLTNGMSSLNSALNELGPKSSWYYYPVFKINNPDFLGEMYFVRLDTKSKYIFKLELGRNTVPKNYISLLSMSSDDPIFYGYPYPLVEADKSARVTNREKDYLKTLFLSKVENKARLEYLLSNLDAHDILDNIG